MVIRLQGRLNADQIAKTCWSVSLRLTTMTVDCWLMSRDFTCGWEIIKVIQPLILCLEKICNQIKQWIILTKENYSAPPEFIQKTVSLLTWWTRFIHCPEKATLSSTWLPSSPESFHWKHDRSDSIHCPGKKCMVRLKSFRFKNIRQKPIYIDSSYAK